MSSLKIILNTLSPGEKDPKYHLPPSHITYLKITEKVEIKEQVGIEKNKSSKVFHDFFDFLALFYSRSNLA